MHVRETVVHHISEEDDCVWTFALRDAPRLAQIRVDEDPGHGPKERIAFRVRPLVENLWIGDEEDVSRRLSLMSTNRRPSQSVKPRGAAVERKRGHVLLLYLAIDSVHPLRRIYRFRAIRRLQPRRFLWLSVNTWVPAYRGMSKPDSAERPAYDSRSPRGLGMGIERLDWERMVRP
jgi:hypothetical protein